MYYTPDISDYADIVRKVHQKYCDIYGYELVVNLSRMTLNSRISDKVYYMSQNLDNFDYIMWVDADAVIINFDRRIEDLIQMDPGKNFYTGGHHKGFDPEGNSIYPIHNDLPAGINTGVFIVRKSKWSKAFLDLWWSTCLRFGPNRIAFDEQGILQQFFLSNTVNCQENISLLPPSEINRDDNFGEKGDRDVCKYILHLWASSSEARMETMRDVFLGNNPQKEIMVELPDFHIY